MLLFKKILQVWQNKKRLYGGGKAGEYMKSPLPMASFLLKSKKNMKYHGECQTAEYAERNGLGVQPSDKNIIKSIAK